MSRNFFIPWAAMTALALGAWGCASQPQTYEQFERVYARAQKRSEAEYRKYERALEKARARADARSE